MDALFDSLYGATDDELKKAKKGMVSKTLRRKFISAYDDAESKKLDQLQKVEDLRRKFEAPDINGILAAKNEIVLLERAQTLLKEEYKVMFGTEMKTTEEA